MFGLTKNADKTEIARQKELKKEVEFLGSAPLKKGHTLFEINKKTGEIGVAQFDRQDIIYPKGIKSLPKKKNTVIVKEGFFYVPALNKKNAAKKFFKEVIKIQKSKL